MRVGRGASRRAVVRVRARVEARVRVELRLRLATSYRWSAA